MYKGSLREGLTEQMSKRIHTEGCCRGKTHTCMHCTHAHTHTGPPIKVDPWSFRKGGGCGLSEEYQQQVSGVNFNLIKGSQLLISNCSICSAGMMTCLQ